MVINYQIFEEEGLLVQKYKGPFEVDTYVGYTRVLMQQNLIHSVEKVINDFTEIVFNDITQDVIDNVDRMVEIRKQMSKNNVAKQNITVAFYVDKPLPTVIAHLFINNISNINYHYCSSLKGVIEKLKLPINEASLINKLNTLKNTF